MPDENQTVRERAPCESCRERGNDQKGNNKIIYKDGHSYCHACSLFTPKTMPMTIATYENAITEISESLKAQILEESNIEREFIGEAKAIPERGLSLETCTKLEIYSGEYLGQLAVGYQYREGFKIRLPNKEFYWKDKEKGKHSLFALEKCDKNKPVIITEGEYDAAACWELGYQAASVPSASIVDKALLADLETLREFPEIWLAFDSDSPGQNGKERAIEILKDSFLSIITFDPKDKDANDAFLGGRLEKAIASRLELRPNGIVFGSELDYKELWKDPEPGLPLPWPGLQESLYGLEYGQIYTLLAGSSIGKSSFLRELVYYYRINHPQIKIANIFLEENQVISPLSYIAIHKNIPLGKLKRDRGLVPESERADIERTLLNTDNLMFIGKKYEKDSQGLINTIKYLIKRKKFDIIILDHISYIIGRSSVSKHGERRDIDELLYNLQDLAISLKFILIAACHLTDPPNEPGWDDGRVPKLYNGRGSRVLAQVPDGVIALSRNMNNPFEVDKMKIHVLKNRWDGKLGETDCLIYNEETGRLK